MQKWYVTTGVDEDVNYSPVLFEKKIRKVLMNPKGWKKVANVKFEILPLEKFKKIKSKRKIPIRLSTNHTISEICGFDPKQPLSCCDTLTKEIWLNVGRWLNGAPASKLDLYKYRDYMINHEVGHALGRLHAECPCNGCPAPIMMQHTITIGECSPNNMPLLNE